MIDEAKSVRTPAKDDEGAELPAVLDVDSRGVDRAQIRRMLAMSTLERLRWLEEFVSDVVTLRTLNEEHSVR